MDTQPAAPASGVLEDYVCANLEQGLEPILSALDGKRFNRVLLLDILEHLRSPERILRQSHALLAPGGRLIISVPNIANISVRLMLLFGRFEYTSRGILDRDHMRFFTRRTARRLIEEQGFTILREKITVIPLELIVGLAPENFVMKFLTGTLAVFTKLLPGLLGYQIMFSAQSRSESGQTSV